MIPGKIDKLGYKGIDTTELIFDGDVAGADDAPGTPGQGFFHRWTASRSAGQRGGEGVRRRDPGVRAGGSVRAAASHVRKAIAEHQAIAFQLAEMATKSRPRI